MKKVDALPPIHYPAIIWTNADLLSKVDAPRHNIGWMALMIVFRLCRTITYIISFIIVMLHACVNL